MSEKNRETDVEQSWLLLRPHTQVIGRARRPRHLVQRLELAAELFFQSFEDAFNTIVVDEKLQARLRPRQSVAQVRAPDIEDGLGDHQRVLLGHEHVQVPREPWRGGQATAHSQ